MINILPKEEKKKIRTEYRLRLATIVMFAIMVLILTNLVLLVPSYLLVVSKYNSISGRLADQELKQGSGLQQKGIDAQVQAANKNISLFLSSNTNSRLSAPNVISEIIHLKGSTIKIGEFYYDATGPLERFTIAGVAADRDGLAQFVDALKGDATFSDVSLPVSSYVKSTNIEFSIALTHGVLPAPVKK